MIITSFNQKGNNTVLQDMGLGLQLIIFITGFSIGVFVQQLVWLELNYRSPLTKTNGLEALSNNFFTKWDHVADCDVLGSNYFTKPYDLNHGEKENRLRNSSRLLCLVRVTNSDFKAARSVKGTWGKRCDKIIFFGARPLRNGLTKGLKFLGLTNKKTLSWAGKAFNSFKPQDPWDRSVSIWSFVNRRHLAKFDWFLNVDDNAYVIVENLKNHLKQYDPSIPLYSGYTFNMENVICTKPKSGYILSQEAVRRFNMHIEKCSESYNEKTRWETLFESPYNQLVSCVRDSGISIISDRDSLNRQLFLSDGLKQSIIEPKNHVGKIMGFNCCSDLTISFLINSADEMYTTDFTIYQLRAFGIGRLDHLVLTDHQFSSNQTGFNGSLSV